MNPTRYLIALVAVACLAGCPQTETQTTPDAAAPVPTAPTDAAPADAPADDPQPVAALPVVRYYALPGG
ncbi:hypothetical protein OAX78_03800 [Planctomycetota bacterium]|nr:hypothetical protein [Planctomycetota bacterium]